MSFIEDINTEKTSNPNAGMQQFDNDPLPNGLYTFVIEKSEEGPYVDGAGFKPEAMAKYLEENPGVEPGVKWYLTLKVADGEKAGRKLFENFLITPSSNQRSFPTAGGGSYGPEEMLKQSKETAVALLKRCKMEKLGDLTDFTGQVVVLEVKVKADKKPPHTLRNNVVYVLPKDGKAAPVGKVSGSTPHVDDSAAPF